MIQIKEKEKKILLKDLMIEKNNLPDKKFQIKKHKKLTN